MTTQMHLAAQYLAAAGISFVAKKDDDSHTNLGFSQKEGRIISRQLTNNGVSLSLDYKNFSLVWTDDAEAHLELNGKNHLEIIEWLNKRALASKMGVYSYNLHYDLPYTISNSFTFELKDKNQLEELFQLRTRAQNAITAFLEKGRFESEIRIWPHHFDTGAFFVLDTDSSLAIGLGLSIPDTMVNDYYYYISGYYGHDGIATDNFKPLMKGKWMNDGFKGAILPASAVTETEASSFFSEALSAFKN